MAALAGTPTQAASASAGSPPAPTPTPTSTPGTPGAESGPDPAPADTPPPSRPPAKPKAPVSLYTDPCAMEAKASLRCVEQHGGLGKKVDIKTVCSEFIQAYNNCRKQATLERKKKNAERGFFF
ncbi:hypothetical protein H696_04645 [Fonticula alba]|uniref:CHCH domain-containing protein n=1 Tax=Fonticula alba TaxID=691883 RepID=A0A058Z5K8_FONAL|nr:hypothetical protein H696_04645 [Fonticula alba]KCV69228.1 hypothetical protein H696_04645 [Fonticula alba]|eukprot:XP_009496799.1 hypothetical protein H696_04645 [Fonticula alba]